MTLISHLSTFTLGSSPSSWPERISSAGRATAVQLPPSTPRSEFVSPRPKWTASPVGLTSCPGWATPTLAFAPHSSSTPAAPGWRTACRASSTTPAGQRTSSKSMPTTPVSAATTPPTPSATSWPRGGSRLAQPWGRRPLGQNPETTPKREQMRTDANRREWLPTAWCVAGCCRPARCWASIRQSSTPATSAPRLCFSIASASQPLACRHNTCPAGSSRSPGLSVDRWCNR